MRRLAKARNFMIGIGAGFPVSLLILFTLPVGWPHWIVLGVQGLALLLVPVCWYARVKLRREIDAITKQATQRSWSDHLPEHVQFTEAEVERIEQIEPWLGSAIRQISEP